MKRVFSICAFFLGLMCTGEAVAQTVDVQPVNVTLSSYSVSPGGSVTVNWQIRNNGSGTAGSSYSQVRITTSSSSYGNSTNNVGSGIATGTISAGGTVSQSETISVPSTPGTYYVWIIADNTSLLSQSNTSNDFAVSSGLTVQSAQTVDVQPVNVTLSSYSVSPGGSVTVNWQIRNNGSGTAGSSYSQVRITTSSSSYGNSTNNVGSGIATGTISAGGTVSQSETISVPSTPGTYYVWIIADNTSLLTQTNVSNDETVSSALTVQPPNSAPDLVVSGAVGVAPNPVSPGDTVMVGYTVNNRGNGRAAQSITKVQIKDGSGTLLTQQYFTVSPIPAGSSSSQSSGMGIPATTAPGAYTVYIILDYNNAIGQSNTTNDIYSTSLSVQTPQNNISVTSPISGANWQAGTQQDVTWATVGAIGTVNVKLSADGGASYPYILASAVQNTGHATVTVPNISSTNCRIKVESATDNTVFGLSQGSFSVLSQQSEQASLTYETYPSGTVLQPQQSFIKSWVLKNTGTTIWNTSYRLQYVSGNLSTSHSDIPVVVNVPPGQSYPFSVSMAAPTTLGSYQETWEFVNASNQVVPVGSSQTLITSINVVASTSDSLLVTNTTPGQSSLDWGQSTIFVLTVKDRAGNPVAGAMVIGQDEISGKQFQVGPTESNGMVAYQTGQVPTGVPNGAVFHVTFRATKAGYADSPIQTSQIQVIHKLQAQYPIISFGQSSVLSFSAAQNGQLPAAQNVIVSNSGAGTLNWNITGAARWLTVTPTQSIGDSTTVNIQPSSTSLTPDGSPYTDTLVVVSSNASNSPQYIIVHYAISGASSTQYNAGQISITATSITDNPDGTKLASGNVSINNILNFSGPVTINPAENAVSGNCSIYINNVSILERVTVYSGSFKFQLPTSGLTLADFLPLLSRQKLEIGGFSVDIGSLTLLTDGVQIAGDVDFSLAFGTSLKISSLQITRSSGIHVGNISASGITLPDGIGLKDVAITYDPADDEFSGTATVSTQALTVSAGIGFIHGKLDSLGLYAQLSDGIPLDGSGFSLYGLGGGVYGLAAPPTSFDIYGDLSTSDPVMSQIVQFSHLGLTYTIPASLRGGGSLTLFNRFTLANAYFSFDIPSRVEFGGNVDIGGIITGSATLGAKLQPQTVVYGNVAGKVQIPDGNGFIYSMMKLGGAHFPYPITSVDASFENYEVWGQVSVPLIHSVSFDVDCSPVLQGESPAFRLGINFTNSNPAIFGSAISRNPLLNSINRFEGLGLKISRKAPNRFLSVSSVQNLLQSIPITSEYREAIFRLTGSQTVPQSILIRPDGQQFKTGNEVKNAQNGITYVQSDSAHQAFWVIDNPIEGNWQVEITDTTSPTLDVITSVLPLGISMVEPSTDQTSGTIKWVDSGSPDSATVSLYYSKNDYGLNGTLIIGGLRPNNGFNTYTWNFSGVQSGAYYVYAIIQDGRNAPKYCYSPGRIIVPSVVQAPTNFKAVFNDPSVTLTWTAPSNTAISSYYLEYADANEPTYQVSVSVGDTDAVTLTHIIPGRSYDFSISTVDTSGHMSSPVTCGPISCVSKVADNYPAFTFDSRLPFKIQVWSPYSLTVPAVDADGDHLLYSLLSAPSGVTIGAATGQLTWAPTEDHLGLSTVRIRVSDGKGGADSISIQLNVIRPQNPTITFTRTYYNGNESVGIVTVHDDAVDLNATGLQQVTASLITKFGSQSIECVETSPGSGIFTGVFDVASSNLSPGDTLESAYTSTSGQSETAFAYWSVATPVKQASAEIPVRYELYQNYPNPFNPTTTIEYSLPAATRVNLTIYDVLGQKVVTLVNGVKAAGNYSVTWKGTNEYGTEVASGVYFCRLSSATFTAVKKLMLIR